MTRWQGYAIAISVLMIAKRFDALSDASVAIFGALLVLDMVTWPWLNKVRR